VSTEAEQLHEVAEIAASCGVFLHHCRNSRFCVGTPGLPDLVLVGPGGILFRELKSSFRSVTAEQTSWRWMLRAAGGDARVWLPSHHRDGTVVAEILAISGP
jgi:hypothetical protein